MDLEILIGNIGKNLKENIVTNFLKELNKQMEEKYIVDRFEGNYAICENQQTGNMENILKSELPLEIQEGMNLKKENGIFKIDVLNCPVTREKALEELKSNWEDVDDLYVVNNKLNKALKCTNLSRKENIYVKDENLISKSEVGTILKQESGNEFLIDEEKTLELREKLLKMQ